MHFPWEKPSANSFIYIGFSYFSSTPPPPKKKNALLLLYLVTSLGINANLHAHITREIIQKKKKKKEPDYGDNGRKQARWN